MNELVQTESNQNNNVNERETYTDTMLQSVVEKLRKFHEQRQNVLSPTDVNCVGEAIVAAQYLHILLKEDTARYNLPIMDKVAETIGSTVIVNWKEDPRTISVVEVAQVYHTIRSAIRAIYVGEPAVAPKKRWSIWRQ